MISKIEINQGTCEKEGLCVRVCAEGVFEQADQDSFPIAAHPESCSFCGHCLAVCPRDAITHHEMELANFHPFTAEMAIEPDNLMNFLRMRRSVRNYLQKRPVRREVIEKLIETARYAPTGSNAQSLNHIVIRNRELIDKLSMLIIELFRSKVTLGQDVDTLSTLDQDAIKHLQLYLPFYKRVLMDYENGKDPIFYQAPALIITHADLRITTCPLEDATLASFQMMLMAQSLGLGTCYIGNFYEIANESQLIRKLLAIPAENEILMAFTLGYPAIRFRKVVDRSKLEVQWVG